MAKYNPLTMNMPGKANFQDDSEARKLGAGLFDRLTNQSLANRLPATGPTPTPTIGGGAMQGASNSPASRMTETVGAGLGATINQATPVGRGSQSKIGGFNPSGAGYDTEGFKASGGVPDASGHSSSRDPSTGMLFKGTQHPTFHKTLAAESDAGNVVYQNNDGRYYSNSPADMPQGVSPIGDAGPYSAFGQSPQSPTGTPTAQPSDMQLGLSRMIGSATQPRTLEDIRGQATAEAQAAYGEEYGQMGGASFERQTGEVDDMRQARLGMRIGQGDTRFKKQKQTMQQEAARLKDYIGDMSTEQKRQAFGSMQVAHMPEHLQKVVQPYMDQKAGGTGFADTTKADMAANRQGGQDIDAMQRDVDKLDGEAKVQAQAKLDKHISDNPQFAANADSVRLRNKKDEIGLGQIIKSTTSAVTKEKRKTAYNAHKTMAGEVIGPAIASKDPAQMAEAYNQYIQGSPTMFEGTGIQKKERAEMRRSIFLDALLRKAPREDRPKYYAALKVTKQELQAAGQRGLEIFNAASKAINESTDKAIKKANDDYVKDELELREALDVTQSALDPADEDYGGAAKYKDAYAKYYVKQQYRQQIRDKQIAEAKQRRDEQLNSEDMANMKSLIDPNSRAGIRNTAQHGPTATATDGTPLRWDPEAKKKDGSIGAYVGGA